MLILAYISFDSYVLSRSFDHICMEKARYKFLIIIFILLLLILLDKKIGNVTIWFIYGTEYCSFLRVLKTCEHVKIWSEIDVSAK